MGKGNRPRWAASGVANGIQDVHIRHWNYFIDYVQGSFSNISNWVFRGHRKDTYKLESTIDREIIDKAQTSTLRAKQLAAFRRAIRGKRGPNPPDYVDDKEWWSLGQHYELQTPLLDWTHSPYTAAYFAFFRTDKSDTKHRVVVALDKTTIESGPLSGRITFFVPSSDENARVISQNGLFTYSDSSDTLESLIAANYPGSTSPILRRIFLPNDEREAVLSGLELMNINHLTLFPDLHGASTYCNTRLFR